MNKTILKSFTLLAAAALLTGCNDTMDDKADIDGKYVKTFDTPVFSITGASDITSSTAVIQLSLSDPDHVAEQGVQVANNADFADATNFFADEVGAEAAVALSGLTPETTYYIRPYVFTVNEETIYGTATTITTEASAGWSPLYIGDYTYTIMDGMAGYVDEGLTLYGNDADESLFKIEHWGYDVDFEFSMADDGELFVEPQPLGTEYGNYGPIYVATANNYWGDDYDPSTDYSWYDPSTGTFNFNLVYFVSAGYIGYDIETFQLTAQATVKAKKDIARKSFTNAFAQRPVTPKTAR